MEVYCDWLPARIGGVGLVLTDIESEPGKEVGLNEEITVVH